MLPPRLKKPSLPILKAFPATYGAILAVMFLLTMIFIYRNIYLTIAQVQSVEELERTVSRERLNRVLWDKVIASRLSKLSSGQSEAATSTPALLRDPFAPR